MLAGIRDILIISTPRDLPLFQHLLGDGSAYGISFSYAEQKHPNGLAEAFIIGKDFIGSDCVTLILGDNIFFGHGLERQLGKAKSYKDGATVFAYRVDDPERYGVVSFDKETGMAKTLVEKPENLLSNWAVTGLYFYDNDVVSFARDLKPSLRGELEITDINSFYLAEKRLQVVRLGRGYAWLDTGTHDSLHDASAYVRAIEKRQGIKVMCPEEIAYEAGYLTVEQVLQRADHLGKTGYADYLRRRVTEIGND